MIHVSDLYTTMAVIAQAEKHIPRDRIVDGVNQTTLLLEGDTHGRRDYIHMYEGPNYAATIKQQFKVHWPPPGSPSFKLPVYDLYRDPREERPLKVQGMWSVAYFGEMKNSGRSIRIGPSRRSAAFRTRGSRGYVLRPSSFVSSSSLRRNSPSRKGSAIRDPGRTLHERRVTLALVKAIVRVQRPDVVRDPSRADFKPRGRGSASRACSTNEDSLFTVLGNRHGQRSEHLE
jgi:hypothetical protein